MVNFGVMGFGRWRMLCANTALFCRRNKTAPHSPRRQKLNLRMKSLSLDSPESTELHGQMRRRYPGGTVGMGHGTAGPGNPGGLSCHNYHSGSGGALDNGTPASNNSHLHCKWQKEEEAD